MGKRRGVGRGPGCLGRIAELSCPHACWAAPGHCPQPGSAGSTCDRDCDCWVQPHIHPPGLSDRGKRVQRGEGLPGATQSNTRSHLRYCKIGHVFPVHLKKRSFG